MKRMKPNTVTVNEMLENGKAKPIFYVNTRTHIVRKRWWTKARIPGTVRASRLPGGSGYRGDKSWLTNGNSLIAIFHAEAKS